MAHLGLEGERLIGSPTAVQLGEIRKVRSRGQVGVRSASSSAKDRGDVRRGLASRRGGRRRSGAALQGARQARGQEPLIADRKGLACWCSAPSARRRRAHEEGRAATARPSPDARYKGKRDVKPRMGNEQVRRGVQPLPGERSDCAAIRVRGSEPKIRHRKPPHPDPLPQGEREWIVRVALSGHYPGGAADARHRGGCAAAPSPRRRRSDPADAGPAAESMFNIPDACYGIPLDGARCSTCSPAPARSHRGISRGARSCCSSTTAPMRGRCWQERRALGSAASQGLSPHALISARASD